MTVQVKSELCIGFVICTKLVGHSSVYCIWHWGEWPRITTHRCGSYVVWMMADHRLLWKLQSLACVTLGRKSYLFVSCQITTFISWNWFLPLLCYLKCPRFNPKLKLLSVWTVYVGFHVSCFPVSTNSLTSGSKWISMLCYHHHALLLEFLINWPFCCFCD